MHELIYTIDELDPEGTDGVVRPTPLAEIKLFVFACTPLLKSKISKISSYSNSIT